MSTPTTHYHAYARLALASYMSDDLALEKFDSLGFPGAIPIHHSNDVDEVFLIPRGNNTFAATCAGSSDLGDWLSNLEALIDSDEFADCARELYDRLKPYLPRGAKITFIGHSRGGAIALYLAYFLAAYYDCELYTYGMPQALREGIAVRVPHYRFVGSHDIVPTIDLPGMAHHGDPYTITRHGDIVPGEPSGGICSMIGRLLGGNIMAAHMCYFDR